MMTEVTKLIASLPRDQVHALEFVLSNELSKMLLRLAQNMAEVARGESPSFPRSQAMTYEVEKILGSVDTLRALMTNLGLESKEGQYSAELLNTARHWLAGRRPAQVA